jgi:hypothetical protein
MENLEKNYRRAVRLLQRADKHLGNLCLELCIDNGDEYETWESIQRFLEATEQTSEVLDEDL